LISNPEEFCNAPVLSRYHAHGSVGARAPFDLRSRSSAGLAGFHAAWCAYRQGKPMRPDVALAFDRMAEAAKREAGLLLTVVSGYRSDAEQAKLFAAHPDPKWVAPPGESLHRYATELDLGPTAAYDWLEANAGRFNFAKRYAWEPWHYECALTLYRASARWEAGGPARHRRGCSQREIGTRDDSADRVRRLL
jgi:hypothetical protein